MHHNPKISPIVADIVVDIDIPIFRYTLLELFKTYIAIFFAKPIRYIGLLHSTTYMHMCVCVCVLVKTQRMH